MVEGEAGTNHLRILFLIMLWFGAWGFLTTFVFTPISYDINPQNKIIYAGPNIQNVRDSNAQYFTSTVDLNNIDSNGTSISTSNSQGNQINTTTGILAGGWGLIKTSWSGFKILISFLQGGDVTLSQQSGAPSFIRYLFFTVNSILLLVALFIALKDLIMPFLRMLSEFIQSLPFF